MLTIQHCRNTENPGTRFELILFTFACQYDLFSLRPRALHTLPVLLHRHIWSNAVYSSMRSFVTRSRINWV